MVLIAEAQQLKAKLMLKGKFRPEKMVRKKMPDGSGMLAKLPERRKDDGLDAAAADKEYCDAIDKVAAVFGQQKRANSTADEHKRYIRTIDGWLVRKGFGSFVEAEVDKHGQLVAVHARRTASASESDSSSARFTCGLSVYDTCDLMCSCCTSPSSHSRDVR